MAFIYGQDCTSDWACAVTIEAERGSKVEFEVFSFLQTGVWGDWKTACSASQRGPHRDRSDEEPIRIPDQSIVIKRLTIQTRRFRPMKMHAFAKPKPDEFDQDEGERKANRLSRGDWHDPLDLIHDYLLENTTNSLYSLASDDDALMLLKMVKGWESYSELKAKLWQEAKKHTLIEVDANGVAALQFTTNPSQPINSKSTNNICMLKQNLDLFKNTNGLVAI